MLKGLSSRISRIFYRSGDDQGGRRTGKEGPDGAQLVDELVQSLDVRRLKEHLIEHPEEVHAVDPHGHHLTHHAAHRGAVMVAELLFARGADPLANNARGLWPAHVAATTGHPNAALYMLERASMEPRREKSRYTTEEIQTELKDVLSGRASHEDLSAVTTRLTGVPSRVLDDPRQLVKLLAQLEAFKGEVAGVDSEGWWQHRFVPQRIRMLIAFLAQERPGAEDRAKVVSEIQTLLDTHRTAERIHTLKKLNTPPVTSMAIEVEAAQMASRLSEMVDGQEACIPAGWDGHALYVGVRRTTVPGPEGDVSALRIRIDNVGQGRSRAHETTEDGQVQTITFHAPTELLMTVEGGRAFDRFLKGILLAKAAPNTGEDDFYVQVARFKGFLNDHIGPKLVAEGRGAVVMPPQTAGNCTNMNAHVGMRGRLGDDLFRRVKGYEVRFANSLIRNTNVDFVVEMERYERDFDRLRDILSKPGPWVKELRDLFRSAQRGAYANILAERLEFKDLMRIVESEDEASIKLLCAHGAREMNGPNGATLIHAAAARGNGVMCSTLVDFGASVTSLDEEGNSPLHLAVKSGSSAAIKVLIDAGAQLDQPNAAGVTPRDMLRNKVDEVSQLAHFLTARPRTRKRPTRALV